MKRPLRLMTWNVNGLRAVLQRLDKSLQQFLEGLGADIVCLQETKMTRSELDQELVRPPGFDAFYSFCRYRGGYSGVVTFVKSDLPTVAAEEGLTGFWQTKDSVGHVGSLHHEVARMPAAHFDDCRVDSTDEVECTCICVFLWINKFSSKLVSDLEAEGRCVITDHQAFVLLNTYCPALASADRLEYKLQFHALLEDRVKALQQANKRVVVVGDINIAHREIDHCDPDAHRMDGSSFADHPCRRWMDGFVGLPEETEHTSSLEPNSQSASISESATPKLVDTFRHFHPTQTKAFTCWNTLTGARQTNYGTRLDYILVDPIFLQCISSCSIEAERLGSDHCPVVISCTVETDSTTNIGVTAALCAKNFVEFSGTQQSIKSFVVRNEGTIENQEVNDLGNNAQASPGHTANSVPKPKKRVNQGQQSITSFFGSAGAKRKSPPSDEYAESIDGSSVYQLFSGVQIVHRTTRKTAEEGKLEWRQVLSGRPPPTPLCYCGQPSILRSVLKANENWGRKFYVCTKPAGEKGNPDARCEFFKWADNKGHKKPKAQ